MRARRLRSRAWAWVVPLVAGLAGVLFATSYATAHGTELRTVGRDLPGLITDQSRDAEAKADQVVQLQAEVDRLSAAAAPGDAGVRALRERTAALAPFVGTQAVKGPAVTVSLDDAHRSAASLPKPYGPDDIVVHQQDVQGVVNALWTGGAEAMTIQDQRVIATSAVQCVGNTLLLQGRVYSPPYVITAIGDPDRLRAALDQDRSVQIYREWVDAVGLGWDVKRADDVELPGFDGSITLRGVTGG